MENQDKQLTSYLANNVFKGRMMTKNSRRRDKLVSLDTRDKIKIPINLVTKGDNVQQAL